MYGAAKLAIDRARAGEGPTLIEAMTYRFNGHVFGDPGAYMDKAEYKLALAADPVPALRARLIAEGHASEAAVAALEAAIDAALDEAVTEAMAAEFPGIAELRRDVYAEELA
jgi:pyruvate dehydrogenase E1 component alpha subunit